MKPSLKQRIKKTAYTIAWLLVLPFAVFSKRIYKLGMNLQFLKDWRAYPNPEWFNHDLDLVFFQDNRQSQYFERGIYASEIVRNKRVLDLCCGDGSLAALFVSPLAKSVYSVDYDPSAIAHAKKRWARFGNCEFHVGDIRKLQLQPGSFDVCLLDKAMEYLTVAEMNQVLKLIKSSLASDGVVHGSSTKKSNQKSHHEHEHEFQSLVELKAFLEQHFKHVLAFERVRQDHTTLYFRASDQPIFQAWQV
ncbi:class I SAM-dependent methyltransferase [bacterium]|nr:class I SAM-dependent methyltransferase [bacterium]